MSPIYDSSPHGVNIPSLFLLICLYYQSQAELIIIILFVRSLWPFPWNSLVTVSPSM